MTNNNGLTPEQQSAISESVSNVLKDMFKSACDKQERMKKLQNAINQTCAELQGRLKNVGIELDCRTEMRNLEHKSTSEDPYPAKVSVYFKRGGSFLSRLFVMTHDLSVTEKDGSYKVESWNGDVVTKRFAIDGEIDIRQYNEDSYSTEQEVLDFISRYICSDVLQLKPEQLPALQDKPSEPRGPEV